MKRYKNLLVLLVVFLMGATAQAQQQRGGPAQRGADPAALAGAAQELRLAADRRVVRLMVPDTAWWTNTALVARLGLTDVQKSRIESTFEAHRQNLVSSKELLEKEEAQLARLLEAEAIDRSAVFTQINRVTQARGEMERANATMTLEMREQLTRAQWMQLQGAQPAAVSGAPTASAIAPARIGADVAAANLISRVNPEYPAAARAARVQGVVLLQATINKEGKVVDLRVVSGHPMLNDAAIEAVRQWRYRPQSLNGQPIDVITTVTVNFSFQ